ncbi:MAG: response regulator [Desulfobulbaceae bacterium]|nr:response regulator [Desulfobulbaceae bacterium]
MNQPNPEHIVEEIRANIRDEDLLKAHLVLNHFYEINLNYQKKILYELSKASSEFSVPLLHYILHKPDKNTISRPLIRDLLLSSIISEPGLLIEQLSKSEISEKQIYIETAGELKLSAATPILIELLSRIDDPIELKLIIENLGLIGDPQAINTLTDYLYSADQDLIVTAITALGQVGTETAMKRLAGRMGTDNQLDILILKVFAQVRDAVALGQLNEALRSHHAGMRTFAKQELTALGPKSIPFLLDNLTDGNNDFVIHSLNILGDIGDDSAILPIRKLLDQMPKNANVRFAAYEALAMLPLRKGAYTLTAGLSDPEDQVCIAAAKAIDRNYSEILSAGIKNLIRTNSEESKHICKIIIDALADNIFLSLMDVSIFTNFIESYLPKIHHDIRDHYLRLLKSKGLRDVAAKLEQGISSGEEPDRGRICAVDDSRMILNIYKSTLHEIGFEPILFEFPTGALEWLKYNKPFVVFTDLNMPKMTGIELTAGIRKLYSHKELPIIMVTTQSDEQDHEAAFKAGVNGLLMKPFSKQSLQMEIDKYVTKRAD